MSNKEILDGFCKILKSEGYRKSKNNLHQIYSGIIYLPEESEQKAHQLSVALGILSYDEFCVIYDETYGKRKKSSTAVKMITIRAGTLLDETDKAYQFGTGKVTNRYRMAQEDGIWLPKSQVEYNEESGQITMPVWLAVKNNYMRRG